MKRHLGRATIGSLERPVLLFSGDCIKRKSPSGGLPVPHSAVGAGLALCRRDSAHDAV